MALSRKEGRLRDIEVCIASGVLNGRVLSAVLLWLGTVVIQEPGFSFFWRHGLNAGFSRMLPARLLCERALFPVSLRVHVHAVSSNIQWCYKLLIYNCRATLVAKAVGCRLLDSADCPLPWHALERYTSYNAANL